MSRGGPWPQAVRRGPRIYGNEAKYRSALRRYVRAGAAFVDRAEGERKQLDRDRRLQGFYLYTTGNWRDDVKKWRGTTLAGLRKYLQDQTRGRPTRAHGWARRAI
jgi:hypothetical protein